MKRTNHDNSLSYNFAARDLVRLLARRAAERRMRRTEPIAMHEKPPSATKSHFVLDFDRNPVEEESSK